MECPEINKKWDGEQCMFCTHRYGVLLHHRINTTSAIPLCKCCTQKLGLLLEKLTYHIDEWRPREVTEEMRASIAAANADYIDRITFKDGELVTEKVVAEPLPENAEVMAIEEAERIWMRAYGDAAKEEVKQEEASGNQVTLWSPRRNPKSSRTPRPEAKDTDPGTPTGFIF